MSIVFDQAVSFYDQTRGLPVQAERALAQALRHHTNLQEESKVLEIGVGTGRIALPLVRENCYSYIGVDLSRAMMQALRDKAQETPIKLVQADMTQLPFPDAVFDAVVAVHVFHLCNNWQTAMTEVQRVLRRGGMLLHGRTDHVVSPIRTLRRALFKLAEVDEHRRAVGLLQWSEVRPQLEQRFGPSEEIATLSWTIERTPQQLLDQLASRIWSSTWSLSDAALAQAVERGRALALDQFGDLEKPLIDEQQFWWELYTRH